MRLRKTATAMALALMAMQAPAWADIEAAKAFLDKEIGDMSSLSRADQEKEMQWFIDAAKPYAGMEIKVVFEELFRRLPDIEVTRPLDLPERSASAFVAGIHHLPARFTPIG